MRGFALIEVVVAMTFLVVVLVGIGSVLGEQVLSVGSSTNEQVANGLLTKAIEQVRSLQCSAVTTGLSTNDQDTGATGDSNSIDYSSWTFKPTGETIPHATYSQQVAPLYPHLTTTTVNNIPFTVGVYPTNYVSNGALLTTGLTAGNAYTTIAVQPVPTAIGTGDTITVGTGSSVDTFAAAAAASVGATTISVTSHAPSHTHATGEWVLDTTITPVTGVIRITVIVSWPPNGLGGVHSITSQSIDPNCGSPPLLQPSFGALAAAGRGASLTVTNGVPGEIWTFDQLQDFFGLASSSFQIEETTTVLGCAETSGGQLTIAGAGQWLSPQQQACSEADNDPGTTPGASQYNSTSQSLWSSYLAGQGSAAAQNSFLGFTSLGSDAASSTSTVSSPGLSSWPASQDCIDLVGNIQSTALPCGSSTDTEGGTDSQLYFTLGTGSVGAAPMVDAAAAPSATKSFVGRYLSGYTSGSTTYCANTSGDGCVHSAAQRSFGTIQLAGIPSAFINSPTIAGWGNPSNNNANYNPNCPSGGNYLIALTNYSDQVSTESGLNAAPPVATGPGANSYLCFWVENQAGTAGSYTAIQVSTLTSGQALTQIPTLSIGVPGVGTAIMTPNLSWGTTQTQSTAGSCGSTPCKASESATRSSPLTGSFQYQITDGALNLFLIVSLNFGDLTANSWYQAAK